MEREIYHIIDRISLLIIHGYEDGFLGYAGVKKKIKRILTTRIITKKGRKLILDFLCELEDGSLLNIEFQFTGPSKYDLDRFHDYNIHSGVEYDALCETLIVSFRSSKSGQKSRKIGKTKSLTPIILYLGDIDFEEILNKIEDKVNDNSPLTNSDEISMMLMSLLPKYKNKKEILERICEILKKEFLFDKTKINTFKAVIKLEIKNLLTKEEKDTFKGEIKMTPEAMEMLEKSFENLNEKYIQLEIEKVERESAKKIKEAEKKAEKAKKEGKKEVAKKLKAFHTPEEISKITGLTVATILKL